MADSKGTPRRDRILSAAVREFAHNGLAGARIEKIAAAARVNKQLLFHYFGSKAGLHRAALESILVPPSSGRSGSPAERLRQFAAQLSATVQVHPALLSLLAAKAPDEGSSSLVKGWQQRALAQARDILEDGQRSGHVRDDVDVGAVSEVIVGASLGRVAASDQMTAGRSEQYVETLLKMTVDFCAWR